MLSVALSFLFEKKVGKETFVKGNVYYSLQRIAAISSSAFLFALKRNHTKKQALLLFLP